MAMKPPNPLAALLQQQQTDPPQPEPQDPYQAVLPFLKGLRPPEAPPEIDVQQVLKHFQEDQRTGLNELFKPFILGERLIGGAVRGASDPEEVGASNPYTGELKGVAEAFPKTLDEALGYLPGSLKQPPVDNYGEPFEVGKKLFPNSKLGAAAVGLGIEFSVPGPDFFKLAKEGKEAKAALSAVREIAHTVDGAFKVVAKAEDGAKAFEVLVRPSKLRNFGIVESPTTGLYTSVSSTQIRTYAPIDKSYAEAAIGWSYKRFKDGSDPAEQLLRGLPVPLSLLPQSKWGEALHPALKSLAEHLQHSDSLIQAFRTSEGAAFRIYAPGVDPKVRGTKFVGSQVFKVDEFPLTKELQPSSYFTRLDELGILDDVAKEVAPVGLVRGDLKELSSWTLLRQKVVKSAAEYQFPEVVVSNLWGNSVKGTLVPIAGTKPEQRAAALVFQELRRSLGEQAYEASPKVFEVPADGSPVADTVVAVFDKPRLHFLNERYQTSEEILPQLRDFIQARREVLKETPDDSLILKQLRQDFLKMISLHHIMGATYDLFDPLQQWIWSPVAGLNRILTPKMTELNPQPIAGAAKSFVESTSNHPLWKEVLDLLGINDTALADYVIQSVKPEVEYSIFTNRINHGIIDNDLVVVPEDVLRTLTGIVENNIEVLSNPASTDPVSIVPALAKQIPRPKVIFKLNTAKTEVPKILHTKSIGLTDWQIQDGYSGTVIDHVAPDETYIDAAKRILPPKTAKMFEQSLKEEVAKGNIVPAYLHTPKELAPYLINNGTYHDIVDTPDIAQHFTNVVKHHLPERVFASPNAFEEAFDIPEKLQPLRELKEIHQQLLEFIDKDPIGFARQAGLTALLQRGDTQSVISSVLRNKGLVAALRESGFELIVRPGVESTIAVPGGSKILKLPEYFAPRFESSEPILRWTPELEAELPFNLERIAQTFDKYAIELPEMKLRRVTDSPLVLRTVQAQIPDYKFDYGIDGLQGMVIRDDGYLATSFNPLWDSDRWSAGRSDVIFEFYVPKGTKALAPGLMSAEFTTETEIVLQKGLPFKILDVGKTKKGEYLVKAQILSGLGAGTVGISAGLMFHDHIPGSTPRPQGDE